MKQDEESLKAKKTSMFATERLFSLLFSFFSIF